MTTSADAAVAPLDLLILGGTGFIGGPQVRYAVSRGHRVTLFNRGQRDSERIDGVEYLVGDRDSGDYRALQGRRFDVCIDNATLVPRRLFDAQDLQAYFKLLLQPSEYEYAYDELPALDCSVVYAVEPVVTRMCGQYFPGAANMHQATPLLKAWHHAAPAGDYAVFVNVRHQAGQVAVFDRKNLLFYNAFGFVKPNDLLYFVLLAYDQFRLSPAEVPLTIGGNLAEDTEAFRLLHRYIDTIRFAALPDSVVLPEETDHLPAHYWHDLFAVAQSQLPHF